jgi:hypothetical protein
MPLLPAGEYRPDVSDYEASTTRNILNVVPRGDGYGPFFDFAALSQALPGPCRGGWVALRQDGSVAIFGATATKLYLMDNTTFAWADVSKGGGDYADIPSPDQWGIKQFGNFVIAVQANVAPQIFDLTTSTEFDDLGGMPPQARYIDIVGRFIVLTGLVSHPYRIQWSGLNGATDWTSGVNSSDYQDFPDGGVVRGVSGGESGVIFQDQAIRRMTYLPGSPLIFQIEVIARDNGLFAPFSLIRAGERTFFYSSQGFQVILPGQYPTPIGREKVDRAILVDLDKSNLKYFIGASDPRNTRVFWAYKSASGPVGGFDKMLCYDWVMDRFTPISVQGEFLFPVTQPGLTLESLDALSGSLDALSGSLDDFVTVSKPEIGAVSINHQVGFFRGQSLEAVIESAEQGTDGQTIKVRGFRPVSDATELFGSASSRMTQQATAVDGAEIAINPTTGRCDMIVSSRYSRMKCRIPAGTGWTFFAGVEPDVIRKGKR